RRSRVRRGCGGGARRRGRDHGRRGRRRASGAVRRLRVRRPRSPPRRAPARQRRRGALLRLALPLLLRRGHRLRPLRSAAPGRLRAQGRVRRRGPPRRARRLRGRAPRAGPVGAGRRGAHVRRGPEARREPARARPRPLHPGEDRRRRARRERDRPAPRSAAQRRAGAARRERRRRRPPTPGRLPARDDGGRAEAVLPAGLRRRHDAARGGAPARGRRRDRRRGGARVRPSRLRLENFGPFVGTHEVDFERLGAHGLFLIHGPTGAGKSSVLDALCFALYGESTGDERRGKDVVSTLAPHAPTRVTLEFEHRGGRYRVVRSPAQTRPKRRGSGLKTYQEEARLEDLTGGRVLADGVRAVSAQVAELLRCDARQFRQTVVLPQGEFRRVVTDHASRHRVLANVFATERFRRRAAALREERGALEGRSREREARRGERLAGVGVNDRQAADVHLADLRADEARRGAEREAKEAAKAAAERALTAAEAVRDDFARYDEAARRVAELERREAETRVEEVTLERARRAAGLADARRILEEAERALTEARREAAAAEAAAVRAAGESESAAVDARELEELRPELER